MSSRWQDDPILSDLFALGGEYPRALERLEKVAVHIEQLRAEQNEARRITNCAIAERDEAVAYVVVADALLDANGHNRDSLPDDAKAMLAELKGLREVSDNCPECDGDGYNPADKDEACHFCDGCGTVLYAGVVVRLAAMRAALERYVNRFGNCGDVYDEANAALEGGG
jgi:hypothetical protein